MIIETGAIVFLSLIALFYRMPRSLRLWLVGHPAWLEVPFGLAAYALHYGTFSGMMAAATAACICFAFTEMHKKLIGYVRDGQFHPGIIYHR